MELDAYFFCLQDRRVCVHVGGGGGGGYDSRREGEGNEKKGM